MNAAVSQPLHFVDLDVPWGRPFIESTSDAALALVDDLPVTTQVVRGTTVRFAGNSYDLETVIWRWSDRLRRLASPCALPDCGCTGKAHP